MDFREWLLRRQQGAPAPTGPSLVPPPSPRDLGPDEPAPAGDAPPPQAQPDAAPATIPDLYANLMKRYGLTANSGQEIDQAMQSDADLQNRANLAKTGEVMMASMQRRAPNVTPYSVEPINLKNVLMKRQLASEDLQRQVGMPLDLAAKMAGIQKTGAEASLLGAQTAKIPQELAQQLQIVREQLSNALTQGDRQRANEYAIALKNIQAQIEARKFGVAAGNPEDSDWDIGPQYTEGIKTLPDAARDVLKRSPGARALLDASTRAEEILGKNPNGVSMGNDAADLGRWLKEMTTQLNNVWGMGIIKQANLPMLEEALGGDPTAFVSRLKTAVKGQEFMHQLNQFQTMVKQRMVSEASAAGLTPKRGGYYESFQPVSGKSAGEIPAATIERAKAKLKAGERLVTDGKAWGAIGETESPPAGWREVE